MIINYQRREELKQFAEDFYQKIKEVENNMKNVLLFNIRVALPTRLSQIYWKIMK
jgi:hypothetical protein